MKKYGNTLLQNLKMAANAIEKSKESLTVKNVSRDTLEKVQELKFKLYELEDIAIKFKIGAAKENLSDDIENDFDTRNVSKTPNRHLERNNSEEDIIENTDMEIDNIKVDKKPGSKLLKCSVCEKRFKKFCDLEWHLKAKHEECQQFKCDKCKKSFVTEWRLKKHSKIHSNKITKQCHFFKNKVTCPFDELGCKFLHTSSDSENEKFCDTIENGLENDIDVEVIVQTDINETSKDTTFTTSTPKKHIRRCENCLDEWECIACLVFNTLTKQEDIKKIFL